MQQSQDLGELQTPKTLDHYRITFPTKSSWVFRPKFQEDALELAEVRQSSMTMSHAKTGQINLYKYKFDLKHPRSFGQVLSPTFPDSVSSATGAYHPETHAEAGKTRNRSLEDLKINNNNFSDLDQLYPHNPLSRRESKKTIVISNKDRGIFERQKLDLQDYRDDLASGPVKQTFFSPSGLRNNYLGHQLLANRAIGQAEKEQQDIVAMGSSWLPGNINIRHNTGARHIPYTSNCMPGPLSVSQAPLVLPSRRPSRTSSLNLMNGFANRDEQGYSDPLVGAPPLLQQRLTELASLEADTIRWERTRKNKKKAKDS